MTLRELRKNKGITQKQAADFVGMPLRTYSNYENDVKKQSSIKYKYILSGLEQSFTLIAYLQGYLIGRLQHILWSTLVFVKNLFSHKK